MMMISRTATLRQLVDQELYVVDEREVATAILLRSVTRALVPGTAFTPQCAAAPIRSFRRHRDAPSFRLVGPRR